MAGWVFPALKAILPHVGTIIEAAKPVFQRRGTGGAKPAPEEQIAELQSAIVQNAEHIKALAEHLRKTVTVLEEEAEIARARLKRAYVACSLAVLLSLAATATAVIALVR